MINFYFNFLIFLNVQINKEQFIILKKEEFLFLIIFKKDFLYFKSNKISKNIFIIFFQL